MYNTVIAIWLQYRQQQPQLHPLYIQLCDNMEYHLFTYEGCICMQVKLQLVLMLHIKVRMPINVYREIITCSYSTFLPAMVNVSDFTHCHMMKSIHQIASQLHIIQSRKLISLPGFFPFHYPRSLHTQSQLPLQMKQLAVLS